MGRHVSQLAAIAAIALIAVSTAFAAGWKTIGKASSSGDFATAAANGTADHPKQLAVKLTGKGVSGFAVVACNKGIASIGSKNTNYRGAGTHLLKLPFANPSNCQVVASVGGSGRITIAILAR